MSDGKRFDALKYGRFASIPELCRYSRALAKLREVNPEGAAAFERDKAAFAVCPIHGEITDPIVGSVGDRVAFACPLCSDPEIRQLWESEMQ